MGQNIGRAPLEATSSVAQSASQCVVSVPARLEHFADFLGQAGQLVNVLVAAGDGAHLELLLVLLYLGVRGGWGHFVTDLVLTGQNAPVQGLLKTLQLRLHVLLGAEGVVLEKTHNSQSLKLQ